MLEHTKTQKFGGDPTHSVAVYFELVFQLNVGQKIICSVVSKLCINYSFYFETERLGYCDDTLSENPHVLISS